MMKIQVIRKEVGFEPEMIEIDNSIEALREQVGGYIEIIGSYVCDGNFVVNEDGKINGLPYNCSIEGHRFHGTVIYIGPLTGDFMDADKAAVNRYRAQAIYGNLGPERWVWA